MANHSRRCGKPRKAASARAIADWLQPAAADVGVRLAERKRFANHAVQVRFHEFAGDAFAADVHELP